jgi:hypothetical protein
LFAAWSGDPAVVVASPPGAGKTRLVVHLAEQLNRRSSLTVAIATQTRAQVLDVTNRAAAIGAKVALLGTRDSHRPMDLHPQAHYLQGTAHLGRWKGVVVATTARWLWVHERDYVAEVCIVDFSSRPRGVFHVGPHLRRGGVAYGCRARVRHSGDHEFHKARTSRGQAASRRRNKVTGMTRCCGAATLRAQRTCGTVGEHLF